MKSSSNQMGFWAALAPVLKTVGTGLVTSAATGAMAPKQQQVQYIPQPVQAAQQQPDYMKYLPMAGLGLMAILLLRD